MATLLKKKPNRSSSKRELVEAILVIARDKNCRVLIRDDNEWKQNKLDEVARLAALLAIKTRTVVKK